MWTRQGLFLPMMEQSTFFALGIAEISMDFRKSLSIWSLNAHQEGALNWRVNLLPMEAVEKYLFRLTHHAALPPQKRPPWHGLPAEGVSHVLASLRVVYPRHADKYLGPLASGLSDINQPVIHSPNRFSIPRLRVLADI
jgi:hypothetical protein